jgi:hypothetical protein
MIYAGENCGLNLYDSWTVAGNNGLVPLEHPYLAVCPYWDQRQDVGQ